MKKALVIFFIGFNLVHLIAQSNEARDYYDYTFGQVNYATRYYNKITGSKNRVEANQYIDSLFAITNRQIKRISQQAVFESNSLLKTYSLNYIKHLNKICKAELPKLYAFKFNTRFSEKDRTTYEKLRMRIDGPTLSLHKMAKQESEKFRSKYTWQYPYEYSLEYEEKESFDTATRYNDYIVDRVDMIDELWTLAIEDEDMQYALEWSELLRKASDKAIRSLEKLKNFNIDFGFRLSAIEYAKHMRSIATNELPEFIRIIRASEMTTEGEARAESLIPILDDQREALFDSVEVHQLDFADTANFEIVGKTEVLIYNYTSISSFDDAQSYNDYVVNMIDIIDHYWTLGIEEEEMNKALSLTDSLNFYSLKAISTLNDLGSFKGYDLFRTTAIDYATHMSKISADQMKEFIRIIRAKKMNSKQEQRAESLIPILDDERERLFGLIEKAQDEFAKTFNIVIVK